MKKVIKLTESDIHRIVKNSVNRILNEIGDTEKGQKALGALHARNVFRKGSLNQDSIDTYNYAENARGGDEYDYLGNNQNPLYTPYTHGYFDYMNAHPEEVLDRHRKDRLAMNESNVKNSVNRILKENIRDMQGSYYELIRAIENFIEELDNHKEDLDPSESKEAVNALINAESVITNLFRHPDAGGDTMVWDNPGF